LHIIESLHMFAQSSGTHRKLNALRLSVMLRASITSQQVPNKCKLPQCRKSDK